MDFCWKIEERKMDEGKNLRYQRLDYKEFGEGNWENGLKIKNRN